MLSYVLTRRRSYCISLETRLVLNSEKNKLGRFLFFFCVTVALANVSCGLIDVQAATDDMCLQNLLFCIHVLFVRCVCSPVD